MYKLAQVPEGLQAIMVPIVKLIMGLLGRL